MSRAPYARRHATAFVHRVVFLLSRVLAERYLVSGVLDVRPRLDLHLRYGEERCHGIVPPDRKSRFLACIIVIDIRGREGGRMPRRDGDDRK